MCRGSGPAQHFLNSLQYVTPHAHTPTHRLARLSKARHPPPPAWGLPVITHPRHSRPGGWRVLRKGGRHFLGACAQTVTQPGEWQQQHRRVGCAAPPPLAAGMTPLCHTPVYLRPSLCLPGSRDHALRFSPAPRGKLAVHYIRNANAGALGRLVPGGHAAAVASLLLGASVRPSPRLGEQGGREGMLGGRGSRELFRGNTGPPRRPLVPRAALLAHPGRQVVCKHLRAWGGESRRSPGCEGRDAVCARWCVCAGCPAVAAPEQEAPDAGTAV